METQIYDANILMELLAKFRSSVKRRCDVRLAVALEEELILAEHPQLRDKTIIQLSKWCKTDGIYAEGMVIARQISLLLFGSILDRNEFGA